MSTPSEPNAYHTPFPAPTKSASGLVNERMTTVNSISFGDKILVMISQSGKLAHWVHVPLVTAAVDPMSSGFTPSSASNNSLLPMSHLTATTTLGGTRRDDEIVGQTLATTIASAILMKQPREERMLVVGLGLETAATDFTDRAQFDEAVALVLNVL